MARTKRYFLPRVMFLDQADVFWVKCFAELQRNNKRFRWNDDDPEMSRAELWLAQRKVLRSGLRSDLIVVRVRDNKLSVPCSSSQ